MNHEGLNLKEVKEIDYEFSATGNLVLYVSEATLTMPEEDKEILYKRHKPVNRLEILDAETGEPLEEGEEE